MKSRVAAERLRDLQSVTDAALAYLPLEELLNELLARVVGILDADTAAILLLEDDDKTLVARAAKGLEEEVERGVRIPVGKGFAGRVAATRAGGPDRERQERGHLQPDPAREGPRVSAGGAAARGGRRDWGPARRNAGVSPLHRRRRRSASERRRPRGARDREPYGRAGARPRRCTPDQPDATASGSAGGRAHRPLPPGRLGPARRRLVRRLPASGRQARHGHRGRRRPWLPRRRDHGAAAQRAACVRARRNATGSRARAPQPPAAPARARPHGDGALPGAGPPWWIAGGLERGTSASAARARGRRPGFPGTARIGTAGRHAPSDLRGTRALA